MMIEMVDRHLQRVTSNEGIYSPYILDCVVTVNEFSQYFFMFCPSTGSKGGSRPTSAKTGSRPTSAKAGSRPTSARSGGSAERQGTPTGEKPPSPAGSDRGSAKDVKPPSPEAAPPPGEAEERVPSRASGGSRPTSAARPRSRQSASREKTQESAQGIQTL